jgi:hypothetical protein
LLLFLKGGNEMAETTEKATKKEKLNSMVSVTFTESQLAAIQEKADEEARTLAAAIRYATLKFYGLA